MNKFYAKLMGEQNFGVIQLKCNSAGKRSLGWMYGICMSGHRIETPNTKYDKWQVALMACLN